MTWQTRLTLWTRPRSLGLHGLLVVIAGGCGLAAWWQVHRALDGNVLSYLYAVEWPVIAIVSGIGWWQLVHDTPEDIARRSEYHRRMRAASAEVVARSLPRSARALTVDSQEVEGLRALAAPAAPARAVTTRTGSDLAEPAVASSTDLVELAPEARLVDGDESDDALDELTAYNRYLATLAVKGRAKTWRNPHGV